MERGFVKIKRRTKQKRRRFQTLPGKGSSQSMEPYQEEEEEEEAFGCKRKGFEDMSLVRVEVLVQLLQIAATKERIVTEEVDKQLNQLITAAADEMELVHQEEQDGEIDRWNRIYTDLSSCSMNILSLPVLKKKSISKENFESIIITKETKKKKEERFEANRA